MKILSKRLLKAILLIIAITSAHIHAQNTFPGTGNVGIGTTSPYVWFGPTPILHMTGDRPTLRMSPTSANGFATLQFRGVTNYASPNAAGATGGSEWHMNFQDGDPSRLSFFSYQLSSSYPAFTLIGNGNVGIGITMPTEKLVVAGNISTTGFIMLAGAGTGKVLTSNASGVASWQTIPGISSQWTTSGSNLYYTTGNIGIATSAPGERLVVNGNISTTGFIMPTGAMTGRVLTSNSTGVASWQTIPGLSSQWTTSGNDLYYTTGNIGIGTTNPTVKLAVAGTISATGLTLPTGAVAGNVLTSDANGVATWQPNVSLASGYQLTSGNIVLPYAEYYYNGYLNFGKILDGQNGMRLTAINANNSVIDVKTNDLNQGLLINVSTITSSINGIGQLFGTTRMIIQANGNVGIGLVSGTPASAKLHVDGDAKFTGNIVSLGKMDATEFHACVTPGTCPDYVFENNYQLLDLHSLKSYLEKNKHLPDVPSAKEMENNGMNINEMNLLLLRKVEEITLYVLQLEGEIQKLKAKK